MAPGSLYAAFSEAGRLCGQGHHKARLTDAQVDEIREMHERGGLGYRRIAARFGVSWKTIRSICVYQSRAVTPFGFKRLSV